MESNDPNTGEGAFARETEFALVARRHNSLDFFTCRIVFGSLVCVSLVIAGVFASFGAWLILPFAGLEIAFLMWVLRWLGLHANDYERVSVRGDVVALDVCEQNRVRHFEFNRVWARLVVDAQSRGLRLALRSHGREIEIGRYLGDSDRLILAQELKGRLHAR